jgi:hypothetical protein
MAEIIIDLCLVEITPGFFEVTLPGDFLLQLASSIGNMTGRVVSDIQTRGEINGL